MKTLMKQVLLSFLATISICSDNFAMHKTNQGSIIPVNSLLNSTKTLQKTAPAYTNKCDKDFHRILGKLALEANSKRKAEEAPLDQKDIKASEILLNLSKSN